MMMPRILAATMGLVGLMLFAAPDQHAKPKAAPSTDCANPFCDCDRCDCGANCDCGTAAPVVLSPAWRVEIQGGRVEVDGCDSYFVAAPAPQVRLPVPIVDTSPNASTCPPGVECPVYPDSVPIDSLGRSVCPTCPSQPAPAAAVDVFGLKPGEILMSVDGQPVNQSCPTCPQAAPAAEPSVTWTNQGNGWLASSTCDGSCPDCPAKQRQAAAAATTHAHSGRVRIYGTPRDGQGWWFGKRFGRALPAWRARRRGY